MYRIADKYWIQGLKSIAVQKMKAALQNECWIPKSELSYTSNMTEEFSLAVQAAWLTTPKADNEVRSTLLAYAVEHKDLIGGVQGFKHVVQQTPQFSCDLLLEILISKSTESLSADPPSMTTTTTTKKRKRRY